MKDFKDLALGRFKISLAGDVSPSDSSRRSDVSPELQETYNRLVTQLSSESLQCDTWSALARERRFDSIAFRVSFATSKNDFKTSERSDLTEWEIKESLDYELDTCNAKVDRPKSLLIFLRAACAHVIEHVNYEILLLKAVVRLERIRQMASRDLCATLFFLSKTVWISRSLVREILLTDKAQRSWWFSLYWKPVAHYFIWSSRSRWSSLQS